eukprot:scaffold436057_cov43-Attheya_sp.AAC.1
MVKRTPQMWPASPRGEHGNVAKRHRPSIRKGKAYLPSKEFGNDADQPHQQQSIDLMHFDQTATATPREKELLSANLGLVERLREKDMLLAKMESLLKSKNLALASLRRTIHLCQTYPNESHPFSGRDGYVSLSSVSEQNHSFAHNISESLPGASLHAIKVQRDESLRYESSPTTSGTYEGDTVKPNCMEAEMDESGDSLHTQTTSDEVVLHQSSSLHKEVATSFGLKCNYPQPAESKSEAVNNESDQARLIKEEKGRALEIFTKELLKSGPNKPGWESRLEELMEFKKKHGHTNVIQSSGPLGRWVEKQRSQYKLLKKGKASAMSLKRREDLEAIGFQFEVHEETWQLRFQELTEFKDKHGHTNVTQNSGRLGGWVTYQRSGYQRLKDGKPSAMTKERLQKLESIEFQFNVFVDAWQRRFRELVKYNKMNGHLNVSRSSGALGDWVHKQKSIKNGQKNSMTLQRIKTLEGIGFSFWEQKIEEP